MGNSNMFERLGEIVANNERYEGDENDHDALPAIFWWFPKQEDFVPPPPTDETCLEKMDRISSTIKLSRNEITEILYTDISPEEKIIRTMEIKREAEHIKQLFKECEADPTSKKGEIAELLAKCRAGLVDYQANVNTMDVLKFATEMQCVLFAKEVRKANKLMGKIEEAAKKLVRYQTTAEQQIEEQRMRFKKIASVAASRVEQMRDLLIRWEEMTNSAQKDALDFQPLTQFLKCYAIYFSQA